MDAVRMTCVEYHRWSRVLDPATSTPVVIGDTIEVPEAEVHHYELRGFEKAGASAPAKTSYVATEVAEE